MEAGGVLQPGLQFVETARIVLPDGVAPTQARKALRKSEPGAKALAREPNGLDAIRAMLKS